MSSTQVMFRPGEPIIYRKQKRSASPGPRAQAVHPDAAGDYYSYCVDKYWRVCQQLDTKRLVVVTRTGKRHVIDLPSPLLRRPSWWERLIYANRFPPPGAWQGDRPVEPHADQVERGF